MVIHLSPRLQQIADYVAPGSTVVDVGTDHAYIPIWLLQRGFCKTAYATDIRPGPLKNAADDADRAGVSDQLTLLLCDGLADCSSDAVDTIIIAGMGGETIIGILAAAPWAKEKHIILQPQTKFAELKSFLSENGLFIQDAALAYDAGRIYRVWKVEPGTEATEHYVESPLIAHRDPLLRPYLEDLMKRLRKQIQGLKQATNTDYDQLGALERELDEYIKIHKEAESWQQ